MLKIDHLSKQYGKNEAAALREINLEIHEGEFIAVLGSSGAGKSTLIRCINRLIDPSSGRLLWKDEDITEFDKKKLRVFRRQVAMIFQNFNLIDRLSVLKNVIVGRFGALPLHRILTWRFSEEDYNSAHEALQIVGMDAFASRRVSELSGGQRQRVAIARALVQQPRMILGDEPVASLDPVTSKVVMDLLESIRKQHNMTMMINLHSVELAKHYATRVIGISKGGVVFDGLPSELDDDVLQKIYVGASIESQNKDSIR